MSYIKAKEKYLKYGIDTETIRRDVLGLIEKLAKLGLVTE